MPDKESSQDPVLQGIKNQLRRMGYLPLHFRENIPLDAPSLPKGSELEGKTSSEYPRAKLIVTDGHEPVIFVETAPPKAGISGALELQAMMHASCVPQGTPPFVWVSDGSLDWCFDMKDQKPIPRADLPTLDEWRRIATNKRIGGSQAESLRYEGQRFVQGRTKFIMEEFDQIHELIYTNKDGVSSVNEAIDEVSKMIFIKMAIEKLARRQKTGTLGSADRRLLADAQRVFSVETVDSEDGVEQIQGLFARIKTHPDFNIFEPYEVLRLENRNVLRRIIGSLNGFNMIGAGHDMLGRAFDVFLRGKFEGKGGLGVYLTPREVCDCMVEMAFADLDDNDDLLRTDSDGLPSFRIGDPFCGSGGLLIRALEKYRYRLFNMPLPDGFKRDLWEKIKGSCFIGADNSPGMVLKARMNMMAYGDGHSRIHRVGDSFTTDVLESGSFDLILTNPPFGKGKINQRNNPGLLEQYFQRGERMLGSKPNRSGEWKLLKSQDPAILAIDRCLELLRPGGRLVIVLPDGILSNSGEQYVRDYLLGVKVSQPGRFRGGRTVIKAVVSLPPVTFGLSGANAKTSFLYLQKKLAGDEQGAIFMAIANAVGFDVKSNREIPIDRNDLLEIARTYVHSVRSAP